MNNQWLAFFRGIVIVKMKGPGAERFLNQLIRAKIPLWNVKRPEKDSIQFSLSLRHIPAIRKYARSFEGKIYLLKGEGAPFLMKRMIRNAGFVIGVFIFFIIVLFLSNVVWRVEIAGASPEMEHRIRKELNQMGVAKGKLIFSIDDAETVQRQLLNHVEGLTWVGVELRGSTYHFQVVEKNTPKEKMIKGPRHLIANKEAVVINMFVEKGQAVVKRNQFVQKGQLLVSGYIGTDEKYRKVAASGKVIGETWYKSVVELPLETNFQTLSGQNVQKKFLQIKDMKLPIWGFEEPTFQNYRLDVQEHPISFLGWTLPVQYVEDIYYETESTQRIYSEKEAEKQALLAARKDLRMKLSKGAKITGEKILHKRLNNGKVKLDIHFQVLEDIAVEQPITQGDKENARRKKHSKHTP